jgi:hypothetical protein
MIVKGDAKKELHYYQKYPEKYVAQSIVIQ